jgi:hypothetical protein
VRELLTAEAMRDRVQQVALRRDLPATDLSVKTAPPRSMASQSAGALVTRAARPQRVRQSGGARWSCCTTASALLVSTSASGTDDGVEQALALEQALPFHAQVAEPVVIGDQFADLVASARTSC